MQVTLTALAVSDTSCIRTPGRVEHARFGMTWRSFAEMCAKAAYTARWAVVLRADPNQGGTHRGPQRPQFIE